MKDLLQSDIIFLDEMTEHDIAVLHGWFLASRPERLTCRPIQEQSLEEVIERFMNRKNKDSLRDFAIKLSKDKTLVGRVTYFDLNKRNRSVEIGFMAGPSYKRKGLMFDAVSVLLNHLFNDLDLNKVMAQTGEFNEASIKLLKKLGFKQDGRLREHHELDGKLYDDLLFSILASEFNTK